jgi:hypothetical protein
VKLGRATVPVPQLLADETLDVRVYTKSRVGGTFTVLKGDKAAAKPQTVVSKLPQGKDEFQDIPECAPLLGTFRGPGAFSIRCENGAGSYGAFASSQECVLVCTVRTEAAAAGEGAAAAAGEGAAAGAGGLQDVPLGNGSVHVGFAEPAEEETGIETTKESSPKKGKVGRGRGIGWGRRSSSAANGK